MAEPTQYSFSLAEVATALIKQQGLHEGKWMVSFDLAVAIGLMGPSPSEARPGASFNIQRVSIGKPPDQGGPSSLIVDASEVNPSSSGKRPKVRQRR
jgi:hypothetical protein